MAFKEGGAERFPPKTRFLLRGRDLHNVLAQPDWQLSCDNNFRPILTWQKSYPKSIRVGSSPSWP